MNNMYQFSVVVVKFVTLVSSQAPGDGDPICVQEVVDGKTSPFFPLHPTYPANEHPLMDSRLCRSTAGRKPTSVAASRQRQQQHKHYRYQCKATYLRVYTLRNMSTARAILCELTHLYRNTIINNIEQITACSSGGSILCIVIIH